jgi:hypothetical protein
MPITITQNVVEELVTPEESIALDDVEDSVDSSKIPSWVHDIFVWYADKTISENELLTALEYLISQGTINVNSD